MRFVLRLGLVDETPRAEPLGLQAAADPGHARLPREHWLTLSSTLKTLSAVVVVGGAFVAQHTLTTSSIAVLKSEQDTLRTRADRQADQLSAMRAVVVPREVYNADRGRQDAINLQLAQNQQAVLLMLAQRKP